MSERYPGGFVTQTPPTPSVASAQGIWTLEQAAEYIRAGTWPYPPQPDAQWNYVTALFAGTSTSGAQNNTFVDSSSNNFTITRNGNTTQGSFSPYQTNGYWSNYFDGTGDYLTVADAAGLEIGNEDFTIECWFYLTAGSNFQYFVSKGTNTDFVPYQLIIDNTNKPAFYASTNGSSFAASLVSSIAAQLNTWNHLAVCRVGSTVTMYLNGASVATGTVSGALFDNTRAVGVGGGSSGTNVVTGYLSNVRIVKGTAVYTAAFTPPTTPLTAISGTALLTCQSNRFIDNSTNAFAITVNGNTSVQDFAPVGNPNPYSPQTIGGSGYFDGSGDYLGTSGLGSAVSGDVTLEAYCYLTSAFPTATSQSIFGPWQTGSQKILLRIDSSSLELFLAGSSIFSVDVSSYFRSQSWNHIAISRSSGTLKAFVNGTQVFSGSNSTSIDLSNMTVGSERTTGINTWAGYLASVRVSSSARYTAAFTPPSSPFVSDGSTSLLLSMTNAGIIDNAMMNDLETVGDAQISTSVKKYGTGSLAFDGTGDGLTLNAGGQNFAFGTGDFTIEMWVYPSTSSQSGIIYDSRPTSTSGLYPTIRLDSGTLKFYTSGASQITGGTLSANTWYHITVCRSGTSTRLFIDGAQSGSTYTDSNSYINGAARPLIGADGFDNYTGSNYFNGYIDDLRITKGYARYTANFTPPTAAFPNT